MTLAADPSFDPDRLLDQQHVTLDDVPWSVYEGLLCASGDRPVRMTYRRGKLEIMSPLPEHEMGKKRIARLIELMAAVREIDVECLGSTTFRREDVESGLEPDECYYVENARLARGMKRFDPGVHPAPDLAIEIDITARSVPRQPIYAALGVPELWRYDGSRLSVLSLDLATRSYRPAFASRAFPFLPMPAFERFVVRMDREESVPVIRDFQAWVRSLA